MSEEKESAIDAIARAFFYCLFNLQQTTTHEWQSLELTMAQLKVLLVVDTFGDLTNSRLAETLNISHPTASHLVDKLVQAGFVERIEYTTDRRYTLVRLTEQGQIMLQQLRQGRLEIFRDWLSQLDEHDRHALQQGLQALSSVVQSSSPQKLNIDDIPHRHRG